MLATNCIEVTGGYQGQRNRVESVATFCIDQLLPKHRTLEIDFHLGNYEQTENITTHTNLNLDTLNEISICCSFLPCIPMIIYFRNYNSVISVL